MIKLTCTHSLDDCFLEGEEYVLIHRRGGVFVEILTKDGYAKDFIMSYQQGIYGYPILKNYFNLVPINKRMVLIEKIGNTYEFEIKKC